MKTRTGLSPASEIDIDLTGATLINFSLAGCKVAKARFQSVTFMDTAQFGKATFNGDAVFGGVTFGGEAGFAKVKFNRDARFHDATFDGYVRFDDATRRQMTFDPVKYGIPLRGGEPIRDQPQRCIASKFEEACHGRKRLGKSERSPASQENIPGWPGGGLFGNHLHGSSFEDRGRWRNVGTPNLLPSVERTGEGVHRLLRSA